MNSNMTNQEILSHIEATFMATPETTEQFVTSLAKLEATAKAKAAKKAKAKAAKKAEADAAKAAMFAWWSMRRPHEVYCPNCFLSEDSCNCDDLD